MEGIPELWRSATNLPGTPTLVVGPARRAVLDELAAWRGSQAIGVSRLLTVEHDDGWQHPEKLLQGYEILGDVDVLFWPEVSVDPIRLLRSLSRRNVVVAEWPGEIVDRRAQYSEPGRRDYYNESLDDVLVVRAAETDRSYELEIVT